MTENAKKLKFIMSDGSVKKPEEYQKFAIHLQDLWKVFCASAHKMALTYDVKLGLELRTQIEGVPKQPKMGD